MAEYSGFFNSIVGDVREYNAAEFAEYFSKFISDGVYSENEQLGLRVTGDGMNVSVATGFAYIRGYIYKNDTILTRLVEPAHDTLNRIDRLVLRFDEVEREIRAEVKTGSYSSSPTPPSLENTGTVKELSLAQIRVNAKASTVQVIDERLTQYCGQVSLLIDVPLQDLLRDWEAWKQDNQAEFNDWRADEETAFQDWLATLEGYLDENVAGNLMNLIDEKMDKDKFIFSDQPADVEQMSEGDVWIQYE